MNKRLIKLARSVLVDVAKAGTTITYKEFGTL
jgi:hypothetical protein